MSMIPPNENNVLYGHADIAQRLKKSYDNGALHHAIILSGPEGVGKETLAYRFMRYALAYPLKQDEGDDATGNMFGDALPETRPDDLSVSADHPVSRKVFARSHPHIFTIQPVFDEKKQRFKRDITLDALDGLAEFLRLMPPDDAPRFILINPADSLNNNTQNALLKMLEEPPANTHFFLLTTQMGRLLPTIRSRCLALTLLPLGFSDFEKAITRLNPELGDARVQALFALSGGAVGLAMQYEEFGVVDSYGDVCRQIIEWHEDGKSRSAMKFAETMAKEDVLSERVVELICDRLSHVLRENVLGKTVDAVIPEEERVLAIWASMPHQALLAVYDEIRALWNTGEASYLDRKLILLQIVQKLSVVA